MLTARVRSRFVRYTLQMKDHRLLRDTRTIARLGVLPHRHLACTNILALVLKLSTEAKHSPMPQSISMLRMDHSFPSTFILNITPTTRAPIGLDHTRVTLDLWSHCEWDHCTSTVPIKFVQVLHEMPLYKSCTSTTQTDMTSGNHRHWKPITA